MVIYYGNNCKNNNLEDKSKVTKEFFFQFWELPLVPVMWWVELSYGSL